MGEARTQTSRDRTRRGKPQECKGVTWQAKPFIKAG
jgi:hypothetical protein